MEETLTAGYLEKLREMEFERVVMALAARGTRLEPGLEVLEIGGGSGYQARMMASMGCRVLSIDIEGSGSHPFYPVQTYDGQEIPAEDARFDLVFSSNVLEHVKRLPEMLGEVRRVLRPGGLAIHILPSASWRFWTSVFYFVHLLRSLPGLHGARPVRGAALSAGSPAGEATHRSGLATRIRRALVHPTLPHGEYASAFDELRCFRRRRWMRTFAEHGFSIEEAVGTHLFYTGFGLLPGLSPGARRRLASLFGSSCHVFVMRAAGSSERSGTPAAGSIYSRPLMDRAAISSRGPHR